MPGRKGVKLIPRKSKSGKFFSVKSLVFSLLEKDPDISREAVEKVVAKEYPNSSFLPKDGKGGHFPWYKHQFTRKGLEKDFNLKERNTNDTDGKDRQKVEPEKKEEPTTSNATAPKPKEDGDGTGQPVKGSAPKPRTRSSR